MGGGGGQQQQMMMSSSIAAVSFSVLAAGGIFLAMQQGWFGGGETTTAAAVVENPDPNATPVTDNLDGARLITNGLYSMRVEGSSCGNQKVVFSKADSAKWLWNLKRVDSVTLGGQTGVPVYTIESFYRVSRKACDKRYLTAPDGCTSRPYLDRYRAMDVTQRWVLVESGGMYQIRSLACTKNMAKKQYIVHSGEDEISYPDFSPGSGTPFELPAASLA